MDLNAYLAKQHLSQAEFAKRLKPRCSQGLVSQWVTGTTKITPRWAKEIERVTAGAVTRMECLYPDDRPRKRRPGDKRPTA